MKTIEILGTGCPKCNKLAELSKKAADEIGLECKIIKINDIQQIMGYGIVNTPALVVDGEVKVSGKLPSIEDLKKMIK